MASLVACIDRMALMPESGRSFLFVKPDIIPKQRPKQRGPHYKPLDLSEQPTRTEPACARCGAGG